MADIQVGKVESGIPLPPRASKLSSYGFDNLKKVNQSIPITGAKIANVRQAIYSFQRLNDGVKLVVRQEGDDANTVRVWRTA